MKVPQKKSFYIILCLYIVAIVFAMAGRTIAGISTGVVTTVIAIWRHLSNEKGSQDNESLNLTQARMLLQGGLGNLFVESIFDEIAQTGANNVSSRLKKALTIEPDNQFAMAYTAISSALAASLWASRGHPPDRETARSLNALYRDGRKRYSNDPRFLDALGTLADSVGKHRIARMWFTQASKCGAGDPGWRLCMATSYALSGDYGASLNQLQQAKAEGLSVWISDFYMGRTLCSLGRFDEALPFLLAARRQRKLRTEIVEWIRNVYHCQTRMTKALYCQFMLVFLYTIGAPLHGLRLVPGTVLYAMAVAYRRICRRIYLIVSRIWPKHATSFERILSPDMLEVDISAQLARNGNYIGAEQVCRRGLGALPESLRLNVNLVMSLAMQGRRDDALHEISKALIRFPNNEILLHNQNALLNEPVLTPQFVDASDTGDRTR